MMYMKNLAKVPSFSVTFYPSKPLGIEVIVATRKMPC
jgi:hypothetical protein